MKVRDVMTDRDRTVTASPETTLKEVAELMVEHRISGLPVVDDEGRVLGVVSEADILIGEAGGTGSEGMLARARALAQPATVAIPRTAGEAMSSPAVTIGPDDTVMHATGRIADRGVNRLPVVDEDGRLLGVISRADVVRWFTRSDEEIAREVRDDLAGLAGVLALAGGVVAIVTLQIRRRFSSPAILLWALLYAAFVAYVLVSG
jgi:CBS domain-containing protein